MLKNDFITWKKSKNLQPVSTSNLHHTSIQYNLQKPKATHLILTVIVIYFFELEVNLIFSSMIHLKSVNDALFASSKMIYVEVVI